MSASEMGERHPKDAKTIEIQAKNASISVVTNQILKIIIKSDFCDSKS